MEEYRLYSWTRLVLHPVIFLNCSTLQTFSVLTCILHILYGIQFLLVIFIIYRCFSSSGEASSVDDYLWLMGRAGYKPVIEYCGGTEIGGGFVTGSLLQPQALSAFSTPAMGCNLFILDSSGNPLVSSWNDGIGFFLNSPFVFFFLQKSIYLIFVPMHSMDSWVWNVSTRHLYIYISVSLALCPTAFMYCLQILIHIISGFFFASLLASTNLIRK